MQSISVCLLSESIVPLLTLNPLFSWRGFQCYQILIINQRRWQQKLSRGGHQLWKHETSVAINGMQSVCFLCPSICGHAVVACQLRLWLSLLSASAGVSGLMPIILCKCSLFNLPHSIFMLTTLPCKITSSLVSCLVSDMELGTCPD